MTQKTFKKLLTAPLNREGLRHFLANENISTWFDLGLFLDRLKEHVPAPLRPLPKKDEDVLATLSQGVAFSSFFFSIDGVTMEVNKYARILKRICPKAKLHFIAGRFEPQAAALIPPKAKRHQIPCLDGFDRWPHYSDFFEKKLQRGGKVYNRLIQDLWAETLIITDALAQIIEEQKISLLFLINTNSNPGNVSFALANVLVSELMGVPVINNCHDFFFEGGASKAVRERKGLTAGPRDHFFKNSHLGEFFSVLQMLYPWCSPNWLTVTINQQQSRHLIDHLGLCPAHVTEVCTAVDTEYLAGSGATTRKRTMAQVAQILGSKKSNTKVRIKVRAIRKVIAQGLLRPHHRAPMLLGYDEQTLSHFETDNMILLQPTRLLARKRFQRNFFLTEHLFKQADFKETFRNHPKMKITLLVSGPVADGHEAYLDKVLDRFALMLDAIDPAYRNRIFLGFLFSAFDEQKWKQAFNVPLGMPELYQLASLVVLPSKTEGRGLPIIESCAAGVPIVARRYEPEEVYAEVVGEHLPEALRLKVHAFSGPHPSIKTIKQVVQCLLFPQGQEGWLAHNQRVVEQRYSMAALQKNIESFLLRLSHFQKPEHTALGHAREALAAFDEQVNQNQAALRKIMNVSKRQYLPGFGQMGFMIYLKSLIDPSYFRVEEQEMRGRAMSFAKGLVDRSPQPEKRSAKETMDFYRAVDQLFRVRLGQESIRHDHSMAYRHRNTYRYAYRDRTPQELTGVINLLFQKFFSPKAPEGEVRRPAKQYGDWHLMVAQLCGSMEVVIDHRKRLAKKLQQNVPIVFFTGRYILHELELFGVHSIRQRLGLSDDEPLTKKHCAQAGLAKIYIFKRRAPLGDHLPAENLKRLIRICGLSELQCLFDAKVAQIIETDQMSWGVDFRQMGKKAINLLAKVKDANGFILGTNRHAAMMTDVVDIERFHLGRVADPIEAGMMGIPESSAYVQWVPAGLRFCLAFPTPIQDGLSFSKTLKSPLFLKAAAKMGEDKVLQILKTESEEKGTPVQEILLALSPPKTKRATPVTQGTLNGLYDDGFPWAGVFAKLHRSRHQLTFKIACAQEGTQRVSEFVKEAGKKKGKRPEIAWNGGYILNAELVGKLGLVESYIGTPLGLLVVDGQMLCPPLFNKPAFCVEENGDVRIQRVHVGHGLTVAGGGTSISFASSQYNAKKPNTKAAYYDLLFPSPLLPGKNRIIIRLAGHRIMSMEKSSANKPVKILPVGLHLSFPADQVPSSWKVGMPLQIQMPGWPKWQQAVEAGPLLVDEGKVAIDMEVEGWKTATSIQTQAARLDYLDMRGPKIAVGMDAKGDITVLVVHGRIRESVGATHVDMAEILQQQGIVKAMGFDPGGSATLVVGQHTLNVSPYNHDYERSPYAMPPEPRPVASAVMAFAK